jgi:hypothetical protein
MSRHLGRPSKHQSLCILDNIVCHKTAAPVLSPAQYPSIDYSMLHGPISRPLKSVGDFVLRRNRFPTYTASTHFQRGTRLVPHWCSAAMITCPRINLSIPY